MLGDELAMTVETMKPQTPNLYNTYEQIIKQNQLIKNGFVKAKDNLNLEFKYLW